MKAKNLLSYPDILSSERTTNIDLASILDDCMGDKQLLQELIALYHHNALEFIGASKIHLANSDFKLLGLAAHKVKTGLAMMQSDGLHAIIVLVQKECDGDCDPKHLQFLCDCFITEYPFVKGKIDEALVKLNLA
ncbi:MAG: hypothetical protein WA913_07910 [Pricia sp.]